MQKAVDPPAAHECGNRILFGTTTCRQQHDFRKLALQLIDQIRHIAANDLDVDYEDAAVPADEKVDGRLG